MLTSSHTVQHLFASDPRTEFVTLSAGWRLSAECPEGTVKESTEIALAQLLATGNVIHKAWSGTAECSILTVVLPVDAWHSRTELSAGSGPRPEAGGGSGPAPELGDLAGLFGSVSPHVVSLVMPAFPEGSTGADFSADDAKSAATRAAWLAQVQSLPSRLTQLQRNGFEQSIVTGAAPLHNLAAAFMALCVLTPGPGTLLFDSFEAAGRGHVAVQRSLVDGVPALTWSCVTRGGGGVDLFQQVIEVVAAVPNTDYAPALERARNFARSNLARASRNPQERASMMTLYALNGWGVELVLDPLKTLDTVTDADVFSALQALTSPLRDTLGWG